jgi:glycosyltransferase involved in cell wall biosynthesis
MAFPVCSETAVVREMHVLDQGNFNVHVFSTRPLKFEGIYEPKADAFKKKSAGFSVEVGLQCLASTVKRVLRRDRRFFKTLATTIRRSGLMLPKTLPVLVLASGYADRAEQMGIAYIHANFASLQGYAAWAIHQMTGIPYGFTMHAYDLFEHGFMMPEKVGSAAVVVSISHFNVRYIQERWGIPPEGIHIIRCGIDIGEFAFVERERGPELRLLSVGRLHPMKGFTHLLDAMALLGKDFPVRLDIVGAGEEGEWLMEKVRRLDLGDRVALRSLVPQDELKALYRRADVYVQPSVRAANGTMDGIPATLMEAMAVGLPCISTRLSGIPELVMDKETGLLVEPGNAAQLADAIRWMGAHADLAAVMGRKGREKVEAEYDATRNARKLAEVVAAAISHHSQALSA